MPTRVQQTPSEVSLSPEPSQATPATSHASLTMRQREGSRVASGSKRKRASTTTGESSNHRRRAAPPPAGDEDNQEDEADDNNLELSSDEDVYDPDQPLEEKRKVQRDYRELLRDINENSEEYLQSGSSGLLQAVKKANRLSKSVRQTTEATIDSRLLVSAADLSYRKTQRLTHGSLTQGIDPEEFVSKCITYMRQGRGILDDDAPELSSTQRQRRGGTGQEEDEIGDEGDMMNWPHLGQFAVLPQLRRPALSGFLLGPLSVEKKIRKITKRSAPFRPNNLTETRPEILNVEDLSKKENDLTVICGKILQRLIDVQADTQQRVEDLIEDDMDDEETRRVMHQHGLRSTGGIDLMRFVVNPRSFGQTVENLFYVSFLIRDGRVEIEYDEHDLPALGKPSHTFV